MKDGKKEFEQVLYRKCAIGEKLEDIRDLDVDEEMDVDGKGQIEYGYEYTDFLRKVFM